MVINVNVLRNQLKETPPNTVYLKQLLEIFRDSLFKFVPSKTEVHQFIKDDLPLDTVDTSTITGIVEKLIHWIEQFQAPAQDYITKKWRKDFVITAEYLCQFVVNYKNHCEEVYKETWKARMRIATNECVIPPEFRAKGKNGIPDYMKSG